jgi:hypothetical protein
MNETVCFILNYVILENNQSANYRLAQLFN